jgi:hypothetical protein
MPTELGTRCFIELLAPLFCGICSLYNPIAECLNSGNLAAQMLLCNDVETLTLRTNSLSALHLSAQAAPHRFKRYAQLCNGVLALGLGHLVKLIRVQLLHCLRVDIIQRGHEDASFRTSLFHVSLPQPEQRLNILRCMTRCSR